MDEMDAERADGPFDAELTSAVREPGTRASDGDSDGESAAERADGPFEAGLTPAVTERNGDSDAEEPVEMAELAGPRRTLEPQIQVVWVLQSAVSAAVVGVVAAVALTFAEFGQTWYGGVVFGAVFVLGAVLALLRYRLWCYQVREDSLYLKRGVFTRVTTVAPYVRIQHVDTRRGPVERAFGLSTTVVYTAGSRGADVSIPGLTPERASDLQLRLKRLAIAAEGEDAV
jgi:membrane protein YdbS with pleckstrin-like domain